MSRKNRIKIGRYISVLILTLATTMAGAFALTNESSPDGFLSGVIRAFSLNVKAQTAGDNEKSAGDDQDTSDRQLGGSDSRLIYAIGTLPTFYPDRRDSIWLHDTVNGPIQLSSINDFEPAWSPDGKKIAFVSVRNGNNWPYETHRDNRGLYIMNSDGTDQQRIYAPYFGGEGQPSWDATGQYIVYVADYTPGGQPSGIFIYHTQTDSHQTVSSDLWSACDPYAKEDKRQGKAPQKNRSGKKSLFPGTFSAETPNFSPDGQHIIFGFDLYGEYELYRIKTNGTECTRLYSPGASWEPLFARYSPDGSMIALAYEENFGKRQYYIHLLDSNGNFIRQIQTTKKPSYLSWSPDGSKIAYIASEYFYDKENESEEYHPMSEIWEVTMPFGGDHQVVFHGMYEAFRGLSWGTPSTDVPPLRLRINDPHPVDSGVSTTGTVYLSSPAPAGGTTVNLTYLGNITEPVFTLPQSSVTVPEGETQATFPINATPGTTYRSADVWANVPSPYANARATVSVMPPKPDLEVTTFTVPPVIAPGDNFQFTSVVTNVGGASTGTNFFDRVYFSMDDVLDHTDWPHIVQLSQSAVAAGGQISRTGTLTVPADRIPGNGTYYLIYETNSGHTVDENLRFSNNIKVIPVQVGLPDLVIEDLSIPSEVIPNVNYNVSWTIRNAGVADAGPHSNHAFYISYDETIGNGDDVRLAQFSIGPLAVGATHNASYTFSIPTVPAMPSGQVMLYVVADINNTVYEGESDGPGEMNNTMSANSQFDYVVSDLQVVSTFSPGEVESDTLFPIEWTTANTGNRDAGSFQEKVYFSIDNQVNSNDVELGTYPLPSGLAAGADVTRIQNVTIPTGVLPVSPSVGNYWIYVRTDTNNNIDEGEGENNNIRWHPVTVRRLLRPDLTVTNITTPDTANFDQMIQVQWTVTNTGKGPTNVPVWKDRININTTGSPFGGTVAEVSNISYLNAGESYVASAAIKVPRGLVGLYKVVVTTDSNGALNEENTTNNSLSRDILLSSPPLPDVIVNEVRAPEQAFAGGPISISWTVENIGDAPAKAVEAAWVDRVYLSTDETFSPATDRLLFTSEGRGVPLAANATYIGETKKKIRVGVQPSGFNEIWEDIILPTNVPGGSYYVFVITDAYNGVYEFNAENNNVAYDNAGIGFPMTVISAPFDLVVDLAPTAPNDLTAGQSLPISFTIRNQGAYNTWGFWRDGLYLSEDQTWDEDDILIGSVNNNMNLAAGASRPHELNAMIPSCVGGTRYLIAKADHENRAAEYDPGYDAEANNASPAKQVQVALTPADLAVTNITIPTITTPGQGINITWTVANNGTGPANGRWSDRITLHSTSGLPVAQLGIFENQGPLNAGTSYTRSENIGLPSYMQGEYYISVTTDYYNSVAECGVAEENNTTNSATFTLENNLPDLVIDSVTAPTSAMAGSTAQIEWTGRNQGATPAFNAQGWSDRVYLSTNTTLSNDDRYLGGPTRTEPLNPGQSYNVQQNVFIGNVPTGTYYILVVADGGNNIYEGPSNSDYEKNNITASSPITITSPGIDLQAVVNSVTTPTYSGQFVNIQWAVTNHGDTQTLTDSWTDRIFLSRDAVIDSSDQLIGWRSHTGYLAGGDSYTVNHMVRLPPGLTGTYRIFILTDADNRVVESSDANNWSPAFDVELELPPPADLNVTNISVPGSASPGDRLHVTWTYQNSGNFPAVGPWRDSVYLSLDPFWDAGDILLGQHSRNDGPLGVGQTDTSGRSFMLPPMEDGQYYVIVRLDSQNHVRETNEANNVAVSTGMVNISMQTLTMGVEHNTTLQESGFKSFKFEPGTDETVLVTLTGQPGNNNNLFSKYLTPANLSNYEFRDDGTPGPNKENLIPETEEGPYYSIVTNDYIPQNLREAFNDEPVKRVVNEKTGLGEMPQNITIKARILPFTIHKVEPSLAGNAGLATLFIDGAKYQQGATVKLVRSGSTEIHPWITRVMSTRIIAIFDLKDAVAGHYDVVVTNPDETFTELSQGFQIVQGGGHSIRETILGQNAFRSGVPINTRITFTASNDGLNDAMLVPAIISIPANFEWELDRSNYIEVLDEDILNEPVDFSQYPGFEDQEGISMIVDGRRFIMLVIPVLQSRSSVNININLKMGASAGDGTIGFTTLPPFEDLFNDMLSEGVPPSELKYQQLGLSGSDPMEIKRCWAAFLVNIGAALWDYLPGVNCADFRQVIAGPVMSKIVGSAGAPTGSATAKMGSVGSWGGFALGVVANIGKCGAKNWPTTYLLSKIWTIITLIDNLADCLSRWVVHGIYRLGSFDPNEMIGPKGYGPERFVPVKTPLYYRINFENVPEATAPAQRIYITDILPPELDPRTVRLKEVGFNHQTFVVPENRAFYSTRVDFEAMGGEAIKADISAGLDIVNRRITWTLTAIDPQTGERPLDPLVGLLPPNNEERDGEGYVTFTVEAYDTFPNRTPVSNFATIYFDENEPIVTNTETNLLDSIIPSSQIEPLSSTSETPEIPITWSGTDDADGSGFSHCEIRVSENGGSFTTAFRTDAIAGSEIFIGKWGTRYGFYSVCADNAGNIESAPILPDAEITVRGGAYESDVSPRPDGSNGVVDNDDVAQIRRFIAKLDTGFTYNEIQRIDAAPMENGGDGKFTVADIIQARRFVSQMDPLRRSGGPNALTEALTPTVAKKDTLGSAREVRVVKVGRIANKLTVAVEIDAEGDEAGVGFTLNYDTAVLGNPSNFAAGTGASNSVITVNDTQAASGKLGIILDKLPSQPIQAGPRQLLTMEFDVAPVSPGSTTFTFTGDVVTDEVADNNATAVNASFVLSSVSLIGPTSANIEITGRVLTHTGNGVTNASVIATAPDGSEITVRTTPFGYYRLSGLTAGRFYVITAKMKGLSFEPRGIDVNNDISGFDLISSP